MSKKSFFSNRKNNSSSIQFLTAQVDSNIEGSRPAATKSAGVIGKWGVTSFTSLRSSCITGEASAGNYSVGKRPLPTYSAPSETAAASSAPAPKKFFKSRGQTEENVAPSTGAPPKKDFSAAESQDGSSRLPLSAVSPPQAKPASVSARSHISNSQRPVFTGDVIIGQSSSESDSGEDDNYSPKGKKKKGKKAPKVKKLIVTPPTRTLRIRKVSELEELLPVQDEREVDSPPVLSPVKEMIEPAKPAIKLKIIRKNDSSLETQLSTPDSTPSKPESTPSKGYSFNESPLSTDSPPKIKIRFRGLDPPVVETVEDDASRPKRAARGQHVSYQELDAEVEFSELPVLQPVGGHEPKRTRGKHVRYNEPDPEVELPVLQPVMDHEPKRSTRARHVSYQELDPEVELSELPVLQPVVDNGTKRSTRAPHVSYQELDAEVELDELPLLPAAEPEPKRNTRARKVSEVQAPEEITVRPRRRTPTPRSDPPPKKKTKKPLPELKPIEEVMTVREMAQKNNMEKGDFENVEKKEEKVESEKVDDNVEEKLASLFGSDSLDENLKSLSSEIRSMPRDNFLEVKPTEVQLPPGAPFSKDFISEIHKKVTTIEQSQESLSSTLILESSQELDISESQKMSEIESENSEMEMLRRDGSDLASKISPSQESVNNFSSQVSANLLTDSGITEDLRNGFQTSSQLTTSEQFSQFEPRSLSELELSKSLEFSAQNSPASSQEDFAHVPQSSHERIAQPKKAFFKNRGQKPEEFKNKKSLALYKHNWTRDSDESEPKPPKTPQQTSSQPFGFAEDFEEPKLLRVATWPKTKDDDNDVPITTVKCPKKAKELYTVVKNVKHAHQIQEQGEFQEYQDDVDYILDALQSGNPVATRCLSAISLAQKCIAPAFRMHLRAHGTVAKFFHALNDAPSNPSVALCTAAVMFVLSLDRLNVDLDRNSLELMLNLLDSEAAIGQPGVDVEYERNLVKVKQICEEMRKKKQATHLSTDHITAAQLAMETLLSLTSRRAGEWFKEELRELGGIEHLIETVSECIEYITALRDWPRQKLEKLVKMDRCLRVLENVSNLNEENQKYLFEWQGGRFIDSFLKLYRTVALTIGSVGEFCGVLKTWEVDVQLKDVLLNILKFLSNLTHDYKSKSFGSSLLGQKPATFESCLVVLFVVPSRLTEETRFDLLVMVLSVMINLVEQTPENRATLMSLKAPMNPDEFLSDSVGTACQSLVRLFFECEMSAMQEEQRTDDILDGKVIIKKEDSQNNILDPEELVKQLLHKAGRHMEDTMVAAYVALIIGYLVIDSAEDEKIVRQMLPSHNFSNLLTILRKFFKFVNLTSNPGSSMRGLKAMERVINFMEEADMPAPPPKLDDSSFILDSSLDLSM